MSGLNFTHFIPFLKSDYIQRKIRLKVLQFHNRHQSVSWPLALWLGESMAEINIGVAGFTLLFHLFSYGPYVK